MIYLKMCVKGLAGSRSASYADGFRLSNKNVCYLRKILYRRKLSWHADSTRKFPPIGAFRAQAIAEKDAGAFQLPVATQKHIQRGKTMLRPSVNTDMRLGEEQNAGHAHAVAKMMKMRGERGRASDISGALEQRLQRVGIGEQGGVAVVEVKQGVNTGGMGHGFGGVKVDSGLA